MIQSSSQTLFARDSLCSVCVCALSVLCLPCYVLCASYASSTSIFLSLKFSNKWLLLGMRKTTTVSPGQPVFGMKYENLKESLEPHFQVAGFMIFN